jgi:hypothetical protein
MKQFLPASSGKEQSFICRFRLTRKSTWQRSLQTEQMLRRSIMKHFWMIINWRNYGNVQFYTIWENLGTRHLGQRVRESLLPIIEQNDLVVLDFTGVNVVSNLFADECIAKLLLQMTLTELKSRTTFEGLNPIASECVLTALRRRHLATSNIFALTRNVILPFALFLFNIEQGIEKANASSVVIFSLIVKFSFLVAIIWFGESTPETCTNKL